MYDNHNNKTLQLVFSPFKSHIISQLVHLQRGKADNFVK